MITYHLLTNTVEPSEGYTDEEKGLFRQLVNSNAVQALYTILIQMDFLGISFGEKDAEYVAKSFCQNAEGRVLNRYLVQFFLSQFWPILLDRSPAFLTSEDFIRSNEIIGTKWPIYVVIGHFILTI